VFPIELSVAADEAGKRLDQFLATHLDVSRARVQQLISEEKIQVNDDAAKASLKLRGGERIRVLGQVERPPLRAMAEDIPLDIVYEDDDLAIINKAAGMMVHAGAGATEDQRNRGTLVNALLHHFANLSGVGGEMRPGIVHRLDKDTSGLLVAAKNERAMTSLARQFAAHAITRAYHAIVWGAPRRAEGLIEGHIGRSPFDRKRMAVLRGEGKEARTRYRVIERFGDPTKPFASFVECRLETGRTHQIRVHLTHLGHPLVGDPTYGRMRQPPRARTPEEAEAYGFVAGFPRQALHAYLLGFQHPSSHKVMNFESPWPKDIMQLVASLRRLHPR